MQSELRTLTGADLRNTSAQALDQLGAVGFTSDGRQFSYVQVGSTDVTAGQLLVTPPVVANHQGIKTASGSQLAVGTTQLTLKLGATAATKDQYAEGYLVVVTGTGKGTAYRIKGNSVGLSSGSCIIDLYQTEPLVNAVDTATTFNLTASPYVAVVASTTAAHAVGVASTNIPANNYGWVQNYGFCAVLIDSSAPTKGASIIQSTATAGAVAIFSGTSAILGNTLENTVSAQTNGVWLQIT